MASRRKTSFLEVVGAIAIGFFAIVGFAYVVTAAMNSQVMVAAPVTETTKEAFQPVRVPVATQKTRGVDKSEEGTPPKPTARATEKLTPTVEMVEPTIAASMGERPFQSPVQRTDWFNEESAWIIAEPGVILDNTAAWVIPSTKGPWYVNVPEGAFTYFSMGEGKISVAGLEILMPGAEGLNYLVVIRGRIDDTIIDSDLNETAEVTDFVPGHAIWSVMPPGAYVSKDWFRQQLVTSTTTGGTNCGATGCSTVHVILADVDSGFLQKFEVKAENLDAWTLLS